MCLKLQLLANKLKSAIGKVELCGEKRKAKLEPVKYPLHYNASTDEKAEIAPPVLPKRNKKLGRTIANDRSFRGAKSIIDEITALAGLPEILNRNAVELWLKSHGLDILAKFNPEARSAACVLISANKSEKHNGKTVGAYHTLFTQHGFRPYTHAPEDDLIRCVWILDSWVSCEKRIKRYYTQYCYAEMSKQYPQIQELALKIVHASYEKDLFVIDGITYFDLGSAAYYLAAERYTHQMKITDSIFGDEYVKKIEGIIEILRKEINY